MNTELNLKLLVLKYSGLTDFKNDDCLEWDLGITVCVGSPKKSTF